MNIVNMRPVTPRLVMAPVRNLWYITAADGNESPVRIVIATDELEAAVRLVNPSVTAMIVSMDYHVTSGDRLGVRLVGGVLTNEQLVAVCRRLEESPRVYYLATA